MQSRGSQNGMVGNMGVYPTLHVPGPMTMGAIPGGGDRDVADVGGELPQENTMDVRTELAPHIIEKKSRALILFHSPQNFTICCSECLPEIWCAVLH